MPRIPTLILFACLLGCSGDTSPPAEPIPESVVTQIGEVSQSQDDVLLTLTVTLVTWNGNDSLNLVSTIQNNGDRPIQYDPGGCACPNPATGIWNEEGKRCPLPRPLCPCWWGTTLELGPQEHVLRVGIFPAGCPEGTNEALAGFFYSVSVNGEWVHRYLEVRFPLG